MQYRFSMIMILVIIFPLSAMNDNSSSSKSSKIGFNARDWIAFLFCGKLSSNGIIRDPEYQKILKNIEQVEKQKQAVQTLQQVSESKKNQ